MKPNRAAGFTLIELMIVVSIIAVLASLAYNSYQDSIRKSRRAKAKADVMSITQDYERWYTVNNTYVGFWAQMLVDTPNRNRSPSEGGQVSYTLTNAEARTTYTITATPSTLQSKDRCGTLSVNSAGTKTSSGAPVGECW